MIRIGKIVATAASITLMLAVTAASAAALEELRSANVAGVRDGYRISWLQGHSVINDQNEMIGTISEFVVGRDSALFAILQVGSFLVLDTYLVAVPFKTLIIDAARPRVSLPGATRKALRNFPQFRFAD